MREAEESGFENKGSTDQSGFIRITSFFDRSITEPLTSFGTFEAVFFDRFRGRQFVALPALDKSLTLFLENGNDVLSFCSVRPLR
jgi:hypothetical protein